MYQILDIAKYISFMYKKIFNNIIDEMKLHKLLYFCQKEYLKKYNELLFNDNFEAWSYGRVNIQVRNKLQDIKSTTTPPDIDNKQKLIINSVISQYAPIDSIELSKLTHNEESWKNARKGLNIFDKCNNIISSEDILKDSKNNIDDLFSNNIDLGTKNFIDSIDEKELTEFAI